MSKWIICMLSCYEIQAGLCWKLLWHVHVMWAILLLFPPLSTNNDDDCDENDDDGGSEDDDDI